MRRPPQRSSKFLLLHTLVLARCRQLNPPDSEPQRLIVNTLNGVYFLQIHAYAAALGGDGEGDFGLGGFTFFECRARFEQVVLALGLELKAFVHCFFAQLD